MSPQAICVQELAVAAVAAMLGAELVPSLPSAAMLDRADAPPLAELVALALPAPLPSLAPPQGEGCVKKDDSAVTPGSCFHQN